MYGWELFTLVTFEGQGHKLQFPVTGRKRSFFGYDVSYEMT